MIHMHFDVIYAFHIHLKYEYSTCHLIELFLFCFGESTSNVDFFALRNNYSI